MTTPSEISFKNRLRNLAQVKRVDTARLWRIIVLERFLVRLSHSKYSSNFVLKGGVLLSHYIELNRYTQDLDFLVQRLSNEIGILERVLGEILEIPIQDGFQFKGLRIDPLPHFHMQYPGVRATAQAFFGKTRFNINIDLGFGDLVSAISQEIPLMCNGKEALFEASVKLRCYPKEFIFAEKLETVIYRKGGNSRMKDFHDIFLLVHDETLEPALTEQVIKAVFMHRKTPLALPINFTEEELLGLQRHWNGHLRGLSPPYQLPTELRVVIEAINAWLYSCPEPLSKRGHALFCPNGPLN